MMGKLFLVTNSPSYSYTEQIYLCMDSISSCSNTSKTKKKITEGSGLDTDHSPFIPRVVFSLSESEL